MNVDKRLSPESLSTPKERLLSIARTYQKDAVASSGTVVVGAIAETILLSGNPSSIEGVFALSMLLPADLVRIKILPSIPDSILNVVGSLQNLNKVNIALNELDTSRNEAIDITDMLKRLSSRKESESAADTFASSELDKTGPFSATNDAILIALEVTKPKKHPDQADNLLKKVKDWYSQHFEPKYSGQETDIAVAHLQAQRNKIVAVALGLGLLDDYFDETGRPSEKVLIQAVNRELSTPIDSPDDSSLSEVQPKVSEILKKHPELEGVRESLNEQIKFEAQYLVLKARGQIMEAIDVAELRGFYSLLGSGFVEASQLTPEKIQLAIETNTLLQ